MQTAFETCIPSRAIKVTTSKSWIHEVKHDGYRLIVYREGNRVRLFTRNGLVRTPVHELERSMRCEQCSERQGRPYKRSQLIALRLNKISAADPPSVWWPGEG